MDKVWAWKHIKVVMGVHDRREKESSAQTRTFKNIIPHGDYKRKGLKNDIALVEVDKPFDLNARVTVACLPKKDYTPPVRSRNCYIAG